MKKHDGFRSKIQFCWLYMEKILKILTIFIFLFSMVGCSQSPTDFNKKSYNNQKNHALDDAQKMSGKLVVSFEEIEFIYQNEKYYLIDSKKLLNDKIQTKRLKDDKFFISETLCITGDVLHKYHNEYRGFGHMEKYDKAISIKSIC